ncbi:hypothetical protein NECAME_14588 [Necator americanus]|uniref:Uncharacterized protein n=1 Tax=Necator americanus TaxID=51031 RepID=W2SM18_NECAM|nr:hypothetical protein NECAME_14588 [Necator americanus]ETN70724.1 hypothetical protein NECAME_14588 [Necator americanus]
MKIGAVILLTILVIHHVSTAEVTDSPTGGVGGIPDLGTALKLVQQLLAVILKILLNAVQGAGGLVGGAAGAT